MKNLQTMKQSVQKGFTLIELMIVVAIIGILAALAIPAYTDYTLKAKISEAASITGAVKTSVETLWSETGEMPLASATIDGLNNTGKYAESIAWTTLTTLTGTLIIQLQNINTTIDAQQVQYDATGTSGANIRWTVSTTGSTILDKYLPKT